MKKSMVKKTLCRLLIFSLVIGICGFLIKDKIIDNRSAATKAPSIEQGAQELEFFIRWNVYGISSYDSKSGQLIKTSDSENPSRFTTKLKLSDEQYKKIWELIDGLDINSYPDKYNPQKDGVSIPHMTLVLSVKTPQYEKTVEVAETILSFDANNKKGQKFLDACKGIIDIITSSEEWLALPEYEKFYE